MTLDLILGGAIIVAILTGILGSIVGLTCVAFDIWTRHHPNPTKDTQ